MSLPFNQTPVDPSLKDLLDMLKKDIFLSLFCHQIGTIKEFDSTNQTASITINYKKTFYQLNAATGLYSPVLVDYPALVDCPVICLGGGATALTFPIQAGDECLVLFNDRDMDNWFQGGAGAALATPRLHSFSDGVALVGLRSLGNVLTDYDATRAVLKNGTTMVGVGPSLIKISNDQFQLKALLDQLIGNINDLVTATNNLVSQTALITVTCSAPASPSSPPINAPAISALAASLTAVATALSTTSTNIGGLLE